MHIWLASSIIFWSTHFCAKKSDCKDIIYYVQHLVRVRSFHVDLFLHKLQSATYFLSQSSLLWRIYSIPLGFPWNSDIW